MRWLFLLFGVGLISCATTQSINVEQRSRVFNKDYNLVMNACIDFLDRNGWTVESVNENLGMISSGFRSSDAFYAALAGSERYKINFRVSKVDSIKTKVIVNFNAENISTFGITSSRMMLQSQAEEIYVNILNNISYLLQEPVKETIKEDSKKENIKKFSR